MTFDRTLVGKVEKQRYTKDQRNKTSLHRVAASGTVEEVTAECMRYPELIDARTEPMRMTPMHYAARRNRPTIIECLFKLGSQALDAKDVNGYTPMHHAARLDHIDVVKQLIALGSKAGTIRSACGHYPIHLSNLHRSTRILDLFCARSRHLVDSSYVPFNHTAERVFQAVITVHRHGSEMYFEPDAYAISEMGVKKIHTGICSRARMLYFSRSITEILFFALNDDINFVPQRHN